MPDESILDEFAAFHQSLEDGKQLTKEKRVMPMV